MQDVRIFSRVAISFGPVSGISCNLTFCTSVLKWLMSNQVKVKKNGKGKKRGGLFEEAGEEEASDVDSSDGSSARHIIGTFFASLERRMSFLTGLFRVSILLCQSVSSCLGVGQYSPLEWSHFSLYDFMLANIFHVDVVRGISSVHGYCQACFLTFFCSIVPLSFTFGC